MIGIVDYGMGNLHSVAKALESLGAKAKVVNNAREFSGCDKLVLPGVGAFDDAMQAMKAAGMVEPLKAFVASGKQFLGICLGMQLLFERSEEARSEQGLGILAGEVVQFKPAAGLKVPHMGWNQITLKRPECPLFARLPEKPYVYFCHSYYVKPRQPQVTAAIAEYGQAFTCVVWENNVFGVQFHPEKSQETGIAMLKNFVAG